MFLLRQIFLAIVIVGFLAGNCLAVSLTVGSDTGVKGDSVTIPVTLDTENSGVGAFDFDIVYDATRLSDVSCDPVTDLNAGFSLVSCDPATYINAESNCIPGTISFSRMSSTALTSGIIANCTFSITSTAESGIIPLTLEPVLVYDNTEDINPIVATRINGAIAVLSPASITSADSANFIFGALNTFTVTTAGYVNPQLSYTGTLPAGVTFTDNGNGTATISGTPGIVGNSPIIITATNQSGTANQTFALNVLKGTASISLGNLNQIYDGTPKSATATTSPVGKSVTFTYDGSTTAPTNAGSYEVVGTINDSSYQGSVTGTLVIALPTLSVTVSGDGFGDINGITCSDKNSGVCSMEISSASVVLYAIPSAISLFGGWSGCAPISATSCNVAMGDNRSVAAIFSLAPKAKIGDVGYPSLNAAYQAVFDSADTGATIKLLDTELSESLLIKGKNITLKGGFKTDDTKSGLPTYLKGTLTIKDGSLRVDGVKIRPNI